MNILPIIFTLLTFLIVKNLKVIKNWWNERKRKIELAEKIPGPVSLPIFGNAIRFFGDSVKMTKTFQEENDKGFDNNDPFRRYWFGDILFIHSLSPEASKVIFDSTIEINKGSVYDFFVDWLGKGLLTSDGDKWKQRRKLITPTFHFGMLKKYYYAFNKESKSMVENFEKFAETGEEVEVFSYIKKVALDIICETAMGVKVNSADNLYHSYPQAVQKYSLLSTEHFKNIFYKFPPFYYIFGDGFERDKTLKILKGFTESVIKQKTIEFEINNKELNDNTFLSNLLKLKEENKWNDEDVREEVETFMFAGHDTTSSLSAFLWWALACYQDIQEKVVEEIYDVFGYEERDVTPEDLSKLTYTEMVIKEALRRYPTVPYISRCLQNEIEVCGYLLPKGANFVFPFQHTNFNSHIFEDPYKFDPERFLPENVAKRNAYDFTPFSAGPRNCIGQKFAMTEAKTMLVWLLRRFKLTTNKSEDFVICAPEVIQCPKTGIPIIFQKRKQFTL